MTPYGVSVELDGETGQPTHVQFRDGAGLPVMVTIADYVLRGIKPAWETLPARPGGEGSLSRGSDKGSALVTYKAPSRIREAGGLWLAALAMILIVSAGTELGLTGSGWYFLGGGLIITAVGTFMAGLVGLFKSPLPNVTIYEAGIKLGERLILWTDLIGCHVEEGKEGGHYKTHSVCWTFFISGSEPASLRIEEHEIVPFYIDVAQFNRAIETEGESLRSPNPA